MTEQDPQRRDDNPKRTSKLWRFLWFIAVVGFWKLSQAIFPSGLSHEAPARINAQQLAAIPAAERGKNQTVGPLQPVTLGGLSLSFPSPHFHGALPVGAAQNARFRANEAWSGQTPGLMFLLVHFRYTSAADAPSLNGGVDGMIAALKPLAHDLKHASQDFTVDGLPAKLVECTYSDEGISNRILAAVFGVGENRWALQVQAGSADKSIVENFQSTVASIRILQSRSQ